jgi:hypothetical protein
LGDRLALVVSKIVSIQKRDFILERRTSDCMIIASKVINVLSKKSFAGNVVLIVDIKKAFNTLVWNILLSVLKQFGINEFFCS